MQNDSFSGIKACDSYRRLFEIALAVIALDVILSAGADLVLNGALKLGLDRLQVFTFIQKAVYIIVCLLVLRSLGVDFRAAWRDWNGKALGDALSALKYFAVYLLIIGAMMALVMLASRLGGAEQEVIVRGLGGRDREIYSAAREVMGVSQAGFFLRLATVCFLAPVGEELVFRRLLYATLRKKIGFARALFASSVIFAASHGTASLLVFPVGLLLGYVYEKKRRLPANILLHGLINLFALAVRIT